MKIEKRNLFKVLGDGSVQQLIKFGEGCFTFNLEGIGKFFLSPLNRKFELYQKYKKGVWYLIAIVDLEKEDIILTKKNVTKKLLRQFLDEIKKKKNRIDKK